MKRNPLLILLCCFFVFIACEKDPPTQDKPIAVVSIKIDKTSDTLSLSVFESKVLQATIMPQNAINKKFIWLSDDETIATISTTGVVIGIKAGSTKIWAKSEENNSIADQLLVIVTDSVIEVSELTLDSNKLSIELDQTKNLSVKVLPANATNRAVSWKSSDETVVTVSRTGSVTGLKLGKAIISVISDANNQKVATCELTVIEKSILATEIWMKTSKVDLKVGESSTLNAVVIPTNTTYQTLVWSSDNESIATVDATGTVTAIKPGTTTIWAKWDQDNSIKDKCTLTVLSESSYSVGDLYPDATNPIGIVFWKDPTNPDNGKIVSLTETKIEWAKEYIKSNALDENEGINNMQTIKSIPNWTANYPAFKWCSDMGSNWYVPAISEMQAIYKSKDAIEAAIISVDGAMGIDKADYWTSTEKKDSQRYYAITIQCYEGFGGGGAPAGGTSFSDKDAKRNMRAVMKFQKQ